MGMSIVVYAKKDDLGIGGQPTSKSLGDAGAPLACCRITPVQEQYLPSGARCEKKSGGERPKCALHTECCGYAKMKDTTTQLEICHNAKTKTYGYKKTHEQEKVMNWVFACIEGAEKLTVSITAGIVAAYMLY